MKSYLCQKQTFIKSQEIFSVSIICSNVDEIKTALKAFFKISKELNLFKYMRDRYIRLDVSQLKRVQLYKLTAFTF